MIIEEGKRYVRRDGTVSRHIFANDNRIYCWTDGWITYTAQGRWGSDNTKTKFDLIAEYKESSVKEVDFTKRLRFTNHKNIADFICPKARAGHWLIGEASSGLIFAVDSYGRNVSTLEKIVENVPEKITRWVNFYSSLASNGDHETKADADRSARPGRIACSPVTFEPGEGL